MNSELKRALEEVVQEAVSNASYETQQRNFVGSVKFSVNDGWVTAEIADLRITD